MYKNKEDAFAVYREQKIRHAISLAEHYKSVIDERSYNALLNFKIITPNN